MHESNQDRAAWARDAVDAFGRETYHGRTFTDEVASLPHGEDTTDSDAYTMIQDLISDLLHLTVEVKWDPDEMLRRAKSAFDYENSPGYEGD